MYKSGRNGLLCGVAAALLFSASAWAQESAPAKPDKLAEVVVTATRVATNLQKTPIAATALSGQALTERNVTTLLDVANFVPNLSIGSRSGTSTASGNVAIRGMGVNAAGSSAAVGIYEDDVYLPSQSGNLLSLFDVNRVEVLRGPQGTLFGRNTIAGAIQYVTNEPGRQFGGYVDVIGGTNSTADIQGALNIPIGENLALRISGASTQEGGFVHDDFADVERGADRTDQGRVKLRWTPTDRLTVDIKAESVHELTNGRAVLVSGVNPDAQFVGLAQLEGETQPLNASDISTGKYTSAGFNSPDYFHSDYDEIQSIVTYDISSDVKFKSISAYSSTRTALAQDFDNTPLPIFSGLLNDDINLFSQEVQLTRQLPSDRFRWTLGGYFYDSQEISTQAIQLGLGPVTFPNGKAKTDILSWAVYGQATYDLTTQLSATAGLRYSSENNSAGFVGTPSPAKATFTNTAPYLGLNYSVTPDAMLYVKASEGFRAGGVTQSLALPGDGVSFAPETAWTYEAGARLQFFDERLRINPTVFLTNWSNIQFNTLIPTATTVVAATQNAGDAQIKGFELESQFAATDQLLLTGSLGLLNGHYTRVGNLTYTTYPFGFVASLPNPVTGLVMPGSTVKLPNITLGQPLMRAPRTQFTVGAQYTLPLAGDSKIVASADYSWTDKQSSAVTIADSVELPAYGVLGARLQYDAPGGHWSAALFGTNLTDQFYLVGGVDFAKGFTTGTTELDVARPREVGVELRAHF